MTGDWEASLDAYLTTPPREARSADDLARCDACGEYVNEDELTESQSDGPAFCRDCIEATGLPRHEAAALLAEKMRPCPACGVTREDHFRAGKDKPDCEVCK